MKRYQELVIASEPPRHLIFAATSSAPTVVERIKIEDSALTVDACIHDVPPSPFGANALVQEWLEHGISLGGSCSPQPHHHTARVRVVRAESYDDREIDIATVAAVISSFMGWAENEHGLVLYASDAQTSVT